MYLLGCDIGSSSAKASIVEIETGKILASDYFPKDEASILAIKPGWAEQNPEDWWKYIKLAIKSAICEAGIDGRDIRAIGISYQMHGLTLIDKRGEVVRPAIIWCDSRAVPYGEQAFEAIGRDECLSALLNSPGNFTAAKLAWVKENEPHIFERVDKFMLPGDYVAMRMTGQAATTVSGLSEGIFWDFAAGSVSTKIMSHYGFPTEIIPQIVPTFGLQGELLASVASELGMRASTPVAYRAGDQPNNALSLNVMNPGEIAATAGTSGVVYGINDKANHDSLSRVNIFAHVNHTALQTRLGTLLCINGVGILNSWIKRNVAPEGLSYEALNQAAAAVAPGSEGIAILPFGNGSERMLENRDAACSIHGLNFNIHRREHIYRAAQEGIVFSFKYGMDIMNEMGIEIKTIRAGHANMFLSPIFREALACVTNSSIELYDTNGAVGAAKAAGVGANYYSSTDEAFASLKKIGITEPDPALSAAYAGAYELWKKKLGE
ncbi:MAG: carbohydrate kinase [Tannerellaceae bacterium]|jgi:xylulokinase|nr:carbohydrate kinase [Tannerellaceae bacterium]